LYSRECLTSEVARHLTSEDVLACPTDRFIHWGRRITSVPMIVPSLPPSQCVDDQRKNLYSLLRRLSLREDRAGGLTDRSALQVEFVAKAMGAIHEVDPMHRKNCVVIFP